MTACALSDPTLLLQTLQELQPDLVLMDVYMPGCRGTDAAQVIRQHSVYRTTPVVYLSTEAGLDAQLDAMRLGGDDFLTKPITAAHLVAAVRIRASRFRELNSMMSRDSLTGLLNHTHLKLALDRELAGAQRRNSTLSVAMLDIDKFKLVNDTYGHPVGDRVIKTLARLLTQRLRKTDIAARYGGEEFALVLPDTSAENAQSVVDGLRAQFAQIKHRHAGGEFSCTFSAGVAAAPPHDAMLALLEAADNALYVSKRTGRNRVSIDGQD